MPQRLQTSLLAFAVMVALPALLPAVAQDEGPPVPVEKAAYHVPVFRNELVTVLRVNIPPKRGAGYHIHSLDQIGVLVEEADQTNQLPGEQVTPPRRNPRGNVTFTAFSKKSQTHRVQNVGETAFHNIVIALMTPQPRGLAPAAREVAGYTQLFDNERARGWRLILEPGQSAPAITQNAPGLRVVIDGGEIVESSRDGERGMALRLGDFYWQEGGVTRAVRNTGTTRIELVEFELK